MAVELYKHNAYAYEQIEEKLKTSNRTCVIHPTGSGKSTTLASLIDTIICSRNNLS